MNDSVSLDPWRKVLGELALPWLQVRSATPLPMGEPPRCDAEALARLRDSAQAHGLDAFRKLNDINVACQGEWRPLVNRIQPEVVDAGYRGDSQERLMPRAGIVAQAYAGPKGRKQVVWRRGGDVAVWYDGQRSTEPSAESAAALVAEGFGLLLLGPLWLVDRGLQVAWGGSERVDGRMCDVVNVWLTPGLGRAATDRAAVCIDRADDVMRRVRYTMEGFANTRGAVAEVDTFEHERRFGVLWPMRSSARIVHPIALPARDWRVTGLDVDRGYPPDALHGPAFRDAAAAPAKTV